MKYATTGINTSTSEVTDISPVGIWILHTGKEYFLGYDDFPWFQNAPVKAVFHFVAESKNHLRWPDLDVDISLDSIRDPGAFPLVYEPEEPYGDST